MADMDTDDDVLEPIDEIEPDDNQPQDDQDEDQGDDDAPPAENDDEEDVITIGGEAAVAEDESPGVRNLREALKKERARARELEAKLAPAQEQIGEKPTLESCGYDEEEFETKLDEWKDRRATVERQENERKEQGRKLQERFETQRQTFESGWDGLRIAGKDAARAKVEETFSDAQQALLIKAARGNAAGLFYVLGSNPERMKALEAVKDDPADFLVEAALLAKDTMVEKRKPTTVPEQRHGGTTGGSGGRADAKLERLEKQARVSGDRTELVRYKKQLAGASA